MALMAAGVPLKAMVAGISCGLVTGDTDDDYGIVELKSGLSETDLIAYPAVDYKEGMKTPTNANNLSDGETADEFSDEAPIEDPKYDQQAPMIVKTEEAAAKAAASSR